MQAPASALVTLTTDFGTADSYVAEMKGVLYAEGPPQLRVVDLSHALPRHDVRAAALFLQATVPRFPKRTVHVAVIDPGVGSDRAPLIACVGDQFVVAPDNGLLTDLLAEGVACFAIDRACLGKRAISSTFHGRDVFAPAAARLALGVAADQLGTPHAAPLRLVAPAVEQQPGQLTGAVVHVDHFGNLITNIHRTDLQALPVSLTHLTVACGPFRGPIQDHYAQVPAGTPLALFDSHGRLEVAVREGHAATQLGVQRGSPVTASLPDPPGPAGDP